MEPHELQARARRAYELGRWRQAALGVLPLVPIVALAVVLGDHAITAWIAVILVVACLACGVIGRGLERAVRPGWLAGLGPMLAALGTSLRLGCTDETCAAVCVPLCATIGLIVGAWLGATIHAHERPRIAAASLGIAILTASLGCATVGLGTLVGAGAGLCVGLIPIFAYRHASEH